MASFSTHVLDTARGMPASGVPVELHVLENGRRRLVASAITNADGRTDRPLIAADRLDVGIYELTFRAGGYFATPGITAVDPPFLGDIVVRVGVADPAGRYHVPLLLAPYGYSVYRGS